jgi:hypothetical protein
MWPSMKCLIVTLFVHLRCPFCYGVKAATKGDRKLEISVPEGQTTNSHGVCAVWIFTEQLKRFLHYNSAIYSLSSQAHTCDNTAQNVNSFFPSSHTGMANQQKTARSMTAERPHVWTARQHSKALLWVVRQIEIEFCRLLGYYAA